MKYWYYVVSTKPKNLLKKTQQHRNQKDQSDPFKQLIQLKKGLVVEGKNKTFPLNAAMRTLGGNGTILFWSEISKAEFDEVTEVKVSDEYK